MKKSSLIKISILSIVILAVVLACFTGLEPAKNEQPNEKETETTLTISFPILPSDGTGGALTQTRAAIQGGGYLYIQIGSDAAAKLYGPYAVGETNTVTIGDLPAGAHPFFAVIYASVKQSNLAPITSDGTVPDEASYRTTLRAALAFGSAASCRVLTNVTILENGNTALSCVLIPLAGDSLDCGYGTTGKLLDLAASSISSGASASTGSDGHAFIILHNFDSIPAAIERKSIAFSIANTSANDCAIRNVALYNPDGTLAASAPAEKTGTVAAGSSVTYFDLSAWTSGVLTLYVRYAGSGLRLMIDAAWKTEFIYVTADGKSVRTINGTDWAVTATGLASCSDLVYGANGFVACGKDSAGYIAVATSSDGYAWTVKVTDSVSASLLAGKLAVRPSDGALAMTYISGATSMASSSADGWSTANTIATNGGNCGIAYVNGKWHTTYSGSGWYGSANGTTWAGEALGSAAMYSMATVKYVNGVFLAGGGNPSAAKTVFRSTDNGASWGSIIQLASSGTTRVESFIPTSTGRILGVGGGTSADKIWYSDNAGISWTATAAPSAAGKFLCGAQTPWGILAGDDTGLLFVSQDDGMGFAQRTIPTTGAITAMSLGSY